MKKLLVLGGITVLVDIVKKAQSFGYYVIVTDNLVDSPAKKVANESWMLSIDDVDAIVKKCLEEHVDGVMNYCLDPGQKPYQKICEKLNIPCVATFEQFNIMTNKDLFKEKCIESGLDVIPEYKYPEDIDIMEFPVMIKPVDSRASKGLCVCHDKSDLEKGIEYALSFSKNKRVIIEKFLKCPEICAKFLAVDGNYYFTTMADVFTCYEENGTRVYLGTQTYPSKYIDEFLNTTYDKVIKFLKLIGLKNGATSFTGFYDNGKFRFFDPSLRMGGAMDWKIVEAASGIDFSDCLTNFAITGSMGKTEVISRVDKAFLNKYSALLYFDLRPGKIAKFDGVEEALKLPYVFTHHQNHLVGDTIETYGTANNVAIRFIVSCDTRLEFVDTVRKIQNLIKIEDSNGKSLIAPLFNPELIKE